MANATANGNSEPAVNPNPKTPAQPIDLNSIPDATWTADKLAAYAHAAFEQSEKSENEVDTLLKQVRTGRRTSVCAYFRAGQALAIVRDQQKPLHTWGAWQTANGLAGTSTTMAIAIFEGAKTEENVLKLTLEQAKYKWVKNYGRRTSSARKPDPQPEAPTPKTFVQTLDTAALTLKGLAEAPIDVESVDAIQEKCFAMLQVLQVIQTRCAKMQLAIGNRVMGGRNAAIDAQLVQMPAQQVAAAA